MADALPHFVAGTWRQGGGVTIERHNPSDNRDLVARVAVGSSVEVGAAVDAATAAAGAWRRATGPARADFLHRWGEAINSRAEELAAAIVREVGKPIVEARGEVARAVVICRYYAGEAVREVGEVIPAQSADTLQFTQHDPLGVVGLITPWNFPVAIPVWKAAPALAFGNTVVLKPSEHSSAVATLLAETAAAAGIPGGVFNVVHGDGGTGALLVGHDGVRGISFTGSAAVGGRVQLAAAGRNVPCQTEMGGKNAVIVVAGADLDRAARLTAGGAFRYAGQKCTATSRVIVESSIIDDFLPRLDAEMHKLVIGPVTDPAAMVGPLVTRSAVERVGGVLAASGLAPEATLQLPDGGEWGHGNWLVPQRYRVDSGEHPLAREELFAPVLVTLEARDLSHAIDLANSTPYGLSASLFTSNIGAAMEYIREIEVGLVRINGDTTGVDPHAPFGGVKGSSSGSREQGRAARDFYTETRTIQIHS